jgi:molybdopterin synthase catalytic subunit
LISSWPEIWPAFLLSCGKGEIKAHYLQGILGNYRITLRGEDNMFVKIVNKPLRPDEIIGQARSDNSGCVVTYVGLIRNTSHEKPVLSVEYQDTDGQAEVRLRALADEIRQKFPVNNLSLCHRIGKLQVGDINIVFAFSCGHRQEGFAACSYAVDRFKETMPTRKIETYQDGSICQDW